MSVRNAVLGLLAQRPRHGYDLHAAFETVAGGRENWEIKPAQIYTTLNRLQESGLVEQQDVAQAGGPEKLIYALTPSGQQELVEWFLQPIEAQHLRDEFFLKLMLSLLANLVDPYKVIRTQRTGLYRELHATTTRRNQADPKRALAYMLLLDRGIMHLEADIRWLDMLEARLDEIRRQPIPEPEVRPRGRPPKGSGG